MVVRSSRVRGAPRRTARLTWQYGTGPSTEGDAGRNVISGEHRMIDRRATRVLPSVALAAALAFGATACSGDSSSKDSSSSSATPDSKKASTALNAGLKAHANGDLTTATSDYKKT